MLREIRAKRRSCSLIEMKFFQSPSYRERDLDPIFSLSCAVPERALRDLLSPTFKDEVEIEGWFYSSENGGTSPFSFIWLCDVLELDAESIRSKLKSLQAHLGTCYLPDE
jgi:hypothetical protein